MNNSYSELLDRLEDFIRKYYRTKWVLGLLYLFCAALSLFILFSSLEFFGYYGKGFRLSLLILFWLVVAWVLIQYFLIPFLAYNRLGKRIDYAQACKIIGDHFPTIKDKLLNALQLSEMGQDSGFNSELIKASIDQKLKSFSSIPFYGAIDQSRNRTYLKALAGLAVCTLLLFLIYPSLLLQGSKRILSFKTDFPAPAPFSFILENTDLSGLKNSNYTLTVKTEGRALPAELYLDQGREPIPFTKVSPNRFSYTFNNLQSDIPFRLYASGFYSGSYLLKVHPSPKVLRFSASIHFPAYLSKPNLLVENSGDLLVPEGSTIIWNIHTQDSDSLILFQNQKSENIIGSSGSFQWQKKAMDDFTYTFVPKNRFIHVPDSFHYSVRVIKDLAPEIYLNPSDTTKSEENRLFSGQIKDDYGFSRLVFHYSYPQTDALGVKTGKSEAYSIPIPINKSLTTQNFGMDFNYSLLKNAKGKNVSYYFEVWDNDGVHGPKSTKTEVKDLYLLSKKEDLAKKDDFQKSTESDIKKAIGQAKKIESEAKSIMEKIQTSNHLSFEDKENIKDVLNQKSLLDSTLSKISKENEKARSNEDPDKSQNAYLNKKEEEMKNLLDSLMSKDSKNLLEKLANLLNENKLRDTKQSMRNFNDQNRSLSEELKRTEALYKQLERDREIQNKIDQLHELAKKENQLADNTLKNEKVSTDEMKNLESEQQKSFDKIKKDLEKLDKDNAQDKINPGFENPEKMEENISENQEKAQQALSKNDKKNAAGSQKKSASGMDELGFKLAQMKQSMDAKELDVDLHSIRLILENLLRISYKQESLMQGLHNTNPNDPSIVNYIQQQFSLKEAINHVQDSLNALALKAPAISSFVNKEMKLVNSNMEQLTGYLADKRFYDAQTNQQYVMTSINNLAVILSNIEKQMAQALSGMKSMGSKPGNKLDLNSLIERQKQLNQQIGKMGQPQEGNGESFNESLVKMAAEQGSIREAIQRLRNKAESKGKMASDLGQIQKEMEESETDFLNKRIKPANTFRQKEILTRMLEAEKAEKEQGMEKKFQSSSGKDYGLGKIKPLTTFLPEKNSEIELLKTLPPSINTYFKMKINTYFNLLNDSQSRNEKLGAH